MPKARDKTQHRVHPKVAFVASHGGHFTELELLRQSLGHVDFILITYSSIRVGNRGKTYRLRNIGANPFHLLVAFFRMALILAKERPEAIISTGAEIAIPAFVLGKVLGSKLVFVESLCRVSKPSATGFLLYPMTDLFLVQWPQLAHHYGHRAEYAGAVV